MAFVEQQPGVVCDRAKSTGRLPGGRAAFLCPSLSLFFLPSILPFLPFASRPTLNSSPFLHVPSLSPPSPRHLHPFLCSFLLSSRALPSAPGSPICPGLGWSRPSSIFPGWLLPQESHLVLGECAIGQPEVFCFNNYLGIL